MNPFDLLFLPSPDVVKVVVHQNDKNRAYFAFLPKIFFIEEQPKISKEKDHLNKIRSSRTNLDIPHKLFETHSHDQIDTNEEESESINISYRMNIIG